MEARLGVVLVAMSLLWAAAAPGAVVDADGSPLTPPGHPGAIIDTATRLIWLDATETLNRSLDDVQSELGPGGEFEGWQLATRDQIQQLLVDANLPITQPGPGWVQDLASQTRVQAFASIYGQTFMSAEIVGTFVWHANTFDSPETFASEAAAWRTTDDGYWAGDNGIDEGWEGTANPSFGVALVRAVSGISENLLDNGGFDFDLSGWDNTFMASWSSEDAEGSPSSGSARLSSAASAYAIRSTCITARPGEEFVYSARYRVPPSQLATGNATIQMGIFDEETCSGVRLDSSEDAGTESVWSTLGNRVVTPAGTASVRVFPFDLRSGGSGELAVDFDDVELVVLPESLIDWVPVGAPGNAADSNQLGAVGDSYEIGRYEVDNSQYVEFLNAVASTDDFGLFNPNMESDVTFGGIERRGSPGSYSYLVKPGFQLNPVVYVSYWDALRFVNWLHNGEPVGMQDASTTEDGAYTLTPDAIANNTVERNASATIALPNVNEWYKAAYFDPTTSIYYDYPTGTDAQISCLVPASDTGNAANCDSAVGALTDGGAYALSGGPNGTFDQGGNADEWGEYVSNPPVSVSLVFGGSWPSAPTDLAGSFGGSIARVTENTFIGFRVVQVPELGTTTQMLLALGSVWFIRRRRHQDSSGVK